MGQYEGAIAGSGRRGLWKDKREEAWRKKTWLWNEEVQEAIRAKKEAFKRWQRERTEENKRRYREKARHTKRAVAAAKA